MNQSAGGDMAPLLEHDQLSKEMKDGMHACIKEAVTQSAVYVEVSCCVGSILNL